MTFTSSPSRMSLLFFVLMEFVCSYSMARTFHVGGDDDWTFRPSKSYNQWAEQYRFEINDTLVFNYEKGRDSVLVVNRNDYTKCNKENPKRVLKYDHSIFKFKKPGSFFFISGHNQNCEKGEKLAVVVPSPDHRNVTAPSPSPTIRIRPSPATSPAAKVKPAKSPSPSPSAKIPTHKPQVHTPSHSPSPKAESPKN